MSRKTMPFGPVTLEVLRVMHERACERVRQLEQELEQAKNRFHELEARHGKQRELAYHLSGCIAHFSLLEDGEEEAPKMEELVGELSVPAPDDKQYWTGE